jgi:predicted oxidoreductase
MRTQSLGRSNLTVGRLAYGCWRLAGSEGGGPVPAGLGERAVLSAVDAGFTFFDLADIYGGGECETIFGRALKQRPGLRDNIVVATKCGIRKAGDGGPAAPYRYDFSADYILRSVEGSLRRLGIEAVDVLILHRPDYLMRADEVAGAFAVLRDSGKVREFGVSNFRPSQWALLQSAVPWPLVTHQIQFSLAHHGPLDDGLVDQCAAAGSTVTAWSPLAGGALGTGAGATPGLWTAITALASKLGRTPAEVALAWLLAHPSRVIPVIGSTQPENIAAAARADHLGLDRESWYALLEAARGARLP